ncbi:MAG: hypothetical protein FWF10_08880 [Clostridiales bacterium]|nr:hypothetical protein [Clostridiales bacterium]
MRTPDGYRFGLQFRAQSDAHRQVGEFLESLGNKKSEVVVAALSEYLTAHPETLNKDNPVRVILTYGVSEETLNAKIEAAVRKLAEKTGRNVTEKAQGGGLTKNNTNALDILLVGLGQFG